MSAPNVETVRELARKYSNWGKWGPDDQVGTLNFVTPEHVVQAASAIRSGKRISMALPFNSDGPQKGGFGRFNPIHLMFRDGGDIVAGTMIDDFYGGRDRHIRGTDDMVIMPLQSGTQWDSLSHILFEGMMYNGHPASNVTSKGATTNDIAQASDRIAGRGVLLDVARYKGVDALEPGYAISADDLAGTESAQGIEVGCGDFVMIRTGQLGPLADDCAEDGQYDFFFCAAPLPFSRAVGSPVNPMAIK
jgi:hypothetical protein